MTLFINKNLSIKTKSMQADKKPTTSSIKLRKKKEPSLWHFKGENQWVSNKYNEFNWIINNYNELSIISWLGKITIVKEIKRIWLIKRFIVMIY